jgi:hypothetical protein
MLEERTYHSAMFFTFRSQMEHPGTEPEPPQREPSDKPPESGTVNTDSYSAGRDIRRFCET